MASNHTLCSETHKEHQSHHYRVFLMWLPAAMRANRRHPGGIPAGPEERTTEWKF
jgi:hypothetical protein